MTMRKKDYEAIARAIKHGPLQDDAIRLEWNDGEAIASAIADYLGSDDLYDLANQLREAE